MRDISGNVGEVLRRIEGAARRAGRDPSEIRLVAVTKSVGTEEIESLAALGIGDIGENRVLEALDRRRAVRAVLRWHMIGRVQTNKVGRLLDWADVLHSVDRPELAQELERRLAASGRRLPCFIQVNVSGEETKAGFRPEDAEGAVTALRTSAPHLEMLGLMTMASEGGDSRHHFRRLRELAGRCGLRDLSMGMSGDFEAAVEEGATIVRVGSALFGA